MVNGSFRRGVVALCALFGLTACSVNEIDLPAPPPVETEYHLNSGDKLSVQVYGQQDLSGQFDIGADGMLALPLVGAMPARGRTVADLSRDLAARLEKLIVTPQLSVTIADYRAVYVLGEVNHAGNFPYVPGLRVQQAIATAGGFTRRAITGKVVLVRQTDQGPQRFAVGPNDQVEPGDTLDVQRRLF